MVGWHHWLDGHECESIPWDSEGQGYLACCSPWGHEELDRTKGLNNDNNNSIGCKFPMATHLQCRFTHNVVGHRRMAIGVVKQMRILPTKTHTQWLQQVYSQLPQLGSNKIPFSRWSDKLRYWYIQTTEWTINNNNRALKRNELSSHKKMKKTLSTYY